MQSTDTKDSKKEDEDDKYLKRHMNCLSNHKKHWEKTKDGSQVKAYICRICYPNVQSEDNK